MRRAERRIRLTGRLLFAAYILILIYFLFFAEWYSHGLGIRDVRRYNFIPFAEIRRFWEHRDSLGFPAVFLNLAGNIIGFVPIGFFFPVIDRKFTGFFATAAAGIALSALVEGIQLLLRLGICDVDDLILNTCGTVIGYLCFLLMRKLRRYKLYGRRKT